MRNLPPDHSAHCYKGVWDQLSTRDGPDGHLLLILDGARIVVPRRARKRILELLHRPHAGVVKTQQAACQLYYWPGMSATVSDYADALLEFRNSLEVAEEARKKTHEEALAEIGNRRLEKFHKGDEVWVQNRITGVWDKDTVVLGQCNGGASFSIYFPESDKISWRNECCCCCCCSQEVQSRALKGLRTEHGRSISKPLCLHLWGFYTRVTNVTLLLDLAES